MRIDSRLVGETAENIFLSLVNQRGVFATAFDSQGLDGVVFDPKNRLFKGRSPFYVQIKCRGSQNDRYHTQGFSEETISGTKDFAHGLGLKEDSLYWVVGFFKSNDIRTITFFAIPFKSLPRFKTGGQYRFSVQRCRDAVRRGEGVFCFAPET